MNMIERNFYSFLIYILWNEHLYLYPTWPVRMINLSVEVSTPSVISVIMVLSTPIAQQVRSSPAPSPPQTENFPWFKPPSARVTSFTVPREPRVWTMGLGGEITCMVHGHAPLSVLLRTRSRLPLNLRHPPPSAFAPLTSSHLPGPSQLCKPRRGKCFFEMSAAVAPPVSSLSNMDSKKNSQG